MPYKSKAQERFFHTATAKKSGITPAVVSEFDKASKGKKLPAHVKKAAQHHVDIHRRGHSDE